MAYWRGFKQYAVDLALTVREKLGVAHYSRLDTEALAKHYGISIVDINYIGCPPEVLHHFTVNRWQSVSGFLLPVDGEFAIVTNPMHTRQRVRATIAHEIAHFILNHEFRVLAAGDDGCIFGDEDQEDEATWLGAELLLPREAAKRAVLRGMSINDLSERFDVSIDMARWRVNMCGARKMLQRARG